MGGWSPLPASCMALFPPYVDQKLGAMSGKEGGFVPLDGCGGTTALFVRLVPVVVAAAVVVVAVVSLFCSLRPPGLTSSLSSH